MYRQAKKLLSLLALTAPLASSALQAQVTPVSQMEKLGRGLVAVRPAGSNFISWRLLGTDAANTTFDLLRDGTVIKSNLTATNYTDSGSDAKLTSSYQVVAKVDGKTVDTSREATPWNKNLTLQLQRPAAASNEDGAYTYTPNDMSVGDVDGDGEYELFVKWDPSNSKDNSEGGRTGNVIIDCYKIDLSNSLAIETSNGTPTEEKAAAETGNREFTNCKLLWRIDLGRNIRAGAHYTQFMVYDFDGDGLAEMMCKTAPGSKDGEGAYVNQAATDSKIKAASNSKVWLNSSGRVDGGHEYLTVFNGLTGKALHTVAYWPNRNAQPALSEATGSFNWDDRSGKTDKASYGNRGERYLAAVAYLDGDSKAPSGIFCRGYYTYAYIWDVDFDGQQLKTRWLHSSDTKTTYKLRDANGKTTTHKGSVCTSGLGRYTMYANGNHNLSVGDVDGDGCDEIIWGSAALNNDGHMLYAVGFGHGDAMHLADLNPDRPGLELFDVHEEKGQYAWDIHDAATGAILWKGGMKGADNGRGMAADIIAAKRGYEFWSTERGPDNIEYDKGRRDRRPYNAVTNAAAFEKNPAMNFRIYWDGDPQDELFDGSFNTDTRQASPTITKATAKDINTLKAFSTADGTPQTCNWTKATPCLQADITGDWREELVMWDYKDPSKIHVYTTTIKTNYRVPTLMHDHIYRMGVAWQNVAYNQPPHLGYYLPDYVSGKLPTAIGSMAAAKPAAADVYDLTGRRTGSLKQGVNIIRENGKTRKVLVK